MSDDYLNKFRLTAEHKAAVKEAFIGIIDKYLEAFDNEYLEMLKGLPRDVAENMTPQDAVAFVDMVVKQAVESITASANVLRNKIGEMAKDEKEMEKIRKSFLDSMGYKEGEQS